MKQIYLPLVLGLILTGCATEAYYPNGQKALVMRSDSTKFAFSGGGITLTADRISNSVPTRAALLGANKITGTVVSGAVGVLVPGSSTTSTVGRAAIVTVPHLFSPVAKPGD